MPPSAPEVETPPTWVEGAAGSGHDVDHLPYAVVRFGDDPPRVVARVGDLVVDLAPLAAADMLEHGEVFGQPSLAPLMQLGGEAWASLRGWLTELLTDPADQPAVEPFLVPVDDVEALLPFAVADYVDFYCSLHHATTVGEIFRPGSEPLPPHWRRLPIGYHGRSGTVVASGTPIRRPLGLLRGPDDGPVYAATERLDLEAEVAYAVGVPTRAGEPVPTDAFERHVFGVLLLDDWSARDVQRYESRPLGPFLGKSFGTSVSPWVTPLAALVTARTDLPGQDPEPPTHLAVQQPAGYAIDLEVAINGTVVSRPPYASTYWSPAQMLAHLTSNGTPLHTGDLFASGTVSGPGPDQRGCLLELTHDGERPLTLADGTSRRWLEDGDEVVVTATAPGALGGRITLGEVRGRVEPAPTAPAGG